MNAPHWFSWSLPRSKWVSQRATGLHLSYRWCNGDVSPNRWNRKHHPKNKHTHTQVTNSISIWMLLDHVKHYPHFGLSKKRPGFNTSWTVAGWSTQRFRKWVNFIFSFKKRWPKWSDLRFSLANGDVEKTEWWCHVWSKGEIKRTRLGKVYWGI